MREYIVLSKYAEHMGINSGDIIFISSDARKMMWDAISHGEKADLNELIDGFIKSVGTEGTVILPTYNWDFCSGIPFDIKKSPCKTGILGSVSLERGDFVRTKHPIYSFAVTGRYADELVAMENVDSFGKDSPFAFLYKNNVKNYIIDVDLQHCFTFVHYVEEQFGNIKYRYKKIFNGKYIDEDGSESVRSYSMFVRNLDFDVEMTIDPIEDDFITQGAEKKMGINSSEVKIIDLNKAQGIILRDVAENRSRKICTFKGQEDGIDEFK